MSTPPSPELAEILLRSSADVPFIPLDLVDATVMLTATRDKNSGVVMTQSRREDGGMGLHQAWFSYNAGEILFKYEGEQALNRAA